MKQPNFGVEAIDDTGRVVLYFASQADARRAGYVQQAISECVCGRRLTHRGLHWRAATSLCRLRQFVDTTSLNELPICLAQIQREGQAAGDMLKRLRFECRETTEAVLALTDQLAAACMFQERLQVLKSQGS